MESVDEQGTQGPPTPSFMGKHCLAAAISHLHNQINLIQEELNQFQTLGESSLVCNQLISSIESIPDNFILDTTSLIDS
ncbi:hypothetical protein Dsin_017702 [Dipteronia sinensis]|uniref:Uncharacterized protein n=1 Tax=Dipteronia sinensis TaxID=43782 RepID=A0AAE0AFH7_9ROSI|nr:hypothetical protein Dsin_017702 [Dipteronia sinensis]